MRAKGLTWRRRRARHTACFDPTPVPHTRPLWIRELRLYNALHALPAPGADVEPPHARSRFRSLADPDRLAEYVVRDASRAPEPPLGAVEDHTLAVVREFRRVPLDASGLALMLFTARPGHAARLIATLAHWVERALSAFQPAYLLLARSLEQPGVSVLLAGVHERRALQHARPSPFSVALVLPEVAPLLGASPERYAYCPEPGPRSAGIAAAPREAGRAGTAWPPPISPDAV